MEMGQCWFELHRRWPGIGLDRNTITAHAQTMTLNHDVKQMPIHCWPEVSDVGPTLKRHLFNVSCLLGTCNFQQLLSVGATTVSVQATMLKCVDSGHQQSPVCIMYVTLLVAWDPERTRFLQELRYVAKIWMIITA